VITLASLSVPAATPPVEKAERWLRILRLHGRVGAALHMVGVPEGPFATVADPTGEPTGGADADSPATVAGWAATMARTSGARTVDTVHVLFAVRKVFGTSLDRALYRQGTTWEQLLKNLVATERTPAAH
jgi:hypothetical protein